MSCMMAVKAETIRYESPTSKNASQITVIEEKLVRRRQQILRNI